MKILLAEDDPSIRTVAVMTLTRVGGHEVIAVEDGKQALELIANNKFDLILLDGMMPELDGFETCKQLQTNPQTKNIPIIFLSAKSQNFEMQQGLALGAIGYIVKPFDPMTLPKQIQDILTSHGVAPDGSAAA